MTLSFAITALIFSLFAFLMSLWTFIEFVAQKRTTHNVQLMPVHSATYDEEGNETLTPKQREELIKTFEM